MYETHATLLFILNHLYSSDPYKIQTSYTLIHCQLKKKKIIGIIAQKINFLASENMFLAKNRPGKPFLKA